MAIQSIAFALAAAMPGHVPLAVPASVPVVADADPAIWVVNDADTTIYLFGTMHSLDGRAQWFNDEVRTAFARSDELVLETLLKPAEQAMAPAPPTSFSASARFAVAAARTRGIDPAHGADHILRAQAVAEGKPVSGLESAHSQRAMLERMPAQSSQPRAAQRNSETSAELAAVIGQLQAAWNRGDQGVFVQLIEQMRRSTPAGYATLFTARNRNWAGWIANRLAQPGVVFVAVGAGHLVGRDSVQAKLSELGVRSARIN